MSIVDHASVKYVIEELGTGNTVQSRVLTYSLRYLRGYIYISQGLFRFSQGEFQLTLSLKKDLMSGLTQTHLL